MLKGSYQFETLVSHDLEKNNLLKRTHLRLEGFTDLLIRHHFPSQGKILEIGCAQGVRSYYMAKYFSQATIIGIDRSEELLEIAHDTYRDTSNLSFQLADLYKLPFADNSFDFIYVRLVFMHLSEPLLAIESLKRVLRPGGRLLIEDADRDCMFFEPQPPSFQAFWQKVQEGQRRRGGDPNVGRKLASYLKASLLKNLHIEVQPIIGGGEEISFLIETLMPSLNLYLDTTERAQGEIAIKALEELAQDPCSSFYHFWFAVSAEKS